MISPSERFCLDYWLASVGDARERGFTPVEARKLASLHQRFIAGAVTEWPDESWRDERHVNLTPSEQEAFRS